MSTIDLEDVLVLPETASCSVCKRPIRLSYNQRHRALRPEAKFQCPGECKQQAQKAQALVREENKRANRGPALVGCVICDGEFYPSLDVWRKHQTGEVQRYYCPACVNQASGNRNTPNQRFGLPVVVEDPKHVAYRDQYFRLQEMGIHPGHNVYRRTW